MIKSRKFFIMSLIVILIIAILTVILTSCSNATASTPASAFFSEVSSGNIDEFTYYKILLDK